MNKPELFRAFAIATVSLLGLLLSTSIALASVPRATCGPYDWTESGLQGQVTPWERESGDSLGGYNCNLELVGQYQGDGAYSQNGPAFAGDCAYYGTDHVTSQQEHLGATVIDASDPTHPVATAYLDTLAMLTPHETLKHNDRRHLLVAGQNNGPFFDVYDTSADCRHPVLKSSIMLDPPAFPTPAPGSQGHMGNFAPDGLTYYLGQNYQGLGGVIHIIDLTDPSNPQPLPTWQYLGDGRPHEIWLNADGTRLYAGQAYGGSTSIIQPGPDGLVIEDVSDYQFRRPNPQIKIVSTLFWNDQVGGEPMYPITVNGHPYVISGDETGAAGVDQRIAGACARGVSPWGYSNIIDIADETHPKIVANLMLEVNDPANCSLILNDPPENVGGAVPTYSPERCTADRQQNPTMLACGLWAAGVRVFDIRDILHPKEIAYYKPPAPGTTFLPGSGTWLPGINATFDKVAGYMRFKKVPANESHGRELQLWFVSNGNGFQILRFSDQFQSAHKALFQKALQKDFFEGAE
jgi:hypothetical protein